MKRVIFILSVVLLMNFTSAGNAADTSNSNREEFKSKQYLFEVVRYLYRWYMDEADINYATKNDEFVFWVKTLTPELDKDDNSRFGMIVIPNLGIEIKVKKADYKIEELNLSVKNDHYKIVNITRTKKNKTGEIAIGYEQMVVSYKEMRDYLFRTRYLSDFPDENLIMKMRKTVRRNIAAGKIKIKNSHNGDRTIYLSPIAPVANDLWVFLVDDKLLFHFSSDMNLSNDFVWEHDDLSVKVFDIEKQTVVSFNEVAGSNAYLTRDQVGRVLFNCMILGKKVVLPPIVEVKK